MVCRFCGAPMTHNKAHGYLQCSNLVACGYGVIVTEVRKTIGKGGDYGTVAEWLAATEAE